MAKKLSLSRPAGTVAIIASVILTLISVALAAGFIVLLGYALSQGFSGKSLSGMLGGLIFVAVMLGDVKQPGLVSSNILFIKNSRLCSLDCCEIISGRDRGY